MAVADIRSKSQGERPSMVYLRNGLCLRKLLNDVAEFGAIGTDREAFRRAIAHAKDRRLNQRFPGHKILEEIGRGAMGVVYRAREIRSDRIVALKCVSSDSSDEVSARFRREAKIAAGLDHPNIVPVYCVSDARDGLPFFTMKFAQGGTLHQSAAILRNRPRDCVRLILKVTLAIAHAHERGILHRDLKPANILLDERGEPLVSDFGLAKTLSGSAELTRTLAVLGTAGYLAPEQAQSPPARVTAAADVYSLGTVLFELLAERTPYVGEDVFSIMQQTVEQSPPKLRSLVPHLDRNLETICARCLQSEPEARYESAGALAQDLQRWLADEPIKARPTPSRVAVARWFRRNRVWAYAVGVGLAAVIASCFWQAHSWQAQSAARESALAARSVAVVPFINLDDLTISQDIGQAVAHSLEQKLGKLGPSRVRGVNIPGSFLAITSPEQTREIGRVTKSRAVLSGTLRTVAGTRQVAFRLLEATTGEPLFVHTSNVGGGISSGTPVDEELARRCYATLQAEDWSEIKEKSDPGLVDERSREAIVAGLELMRRTSIGDLDHAIALFTKAIQFEPRSGVAHSYLAITDTTRTHYFADRSYLEAGKQEAEEAIRLAPLSVEAHRATAGVYYQQGRFRESLEEGLRTVEMGGVDEKAARFLGMTLDTVGQLDRALSWFSLASVLHGVPGKVDAQLGDAWTKLGDDDRALEAYARSRDLQPNCTDGSVGICHTKMLQGDFEGARRFYATVRWKQDEMGDSKAIAAQIEFFARNFGQAVKLYDDLCRIDSDGGGSFYGALSYQSALGRAKQALEDEVGGREMLSQCLVRERAAIRREAENPEAFYRLAATEASLDNLNDSIAHLRDAIQLGWRDYRSLAMDPRFDEVRKDPRFQEVVDTLSAKVAGLRLKAENTNLWRNKEWLPRIGMN
jgi:tetratricopeptide (TPR) repeat protein/predicted Ser/Thr protein kinase/TolB-like protein